MGVINITPNSFSDGGKNLAPETILLNCQKMAKLGASCFDLGAESTAPFNDKVSLELELGRFKENLFPVLGDILKLKRTISIDTYKPAVFSALAEEIYRIDSKTNLIWNDVSGSVDPSLKETLKEYPDCTYVLSHNLAPRRELTSDHMDYLEEELDLRSFFESRLAKLAFHQKILLDPCFGFSKDFNQNWELILKLPELVASFENGWVLGLSKKSFLRSAGQKLTDERAIFTEILHLGILLNWQENLPLNPYYLRVHDVALGHFLTLGQQDLTFG